MGLFRRKKDVNDFKAMAERRFDTDEEPWFAGEDPEADELRIETNRSSNLRDDDLPA